MFRHIRFRLPSWFPRRTLAALLLGCLAAAGCASRDEVFQAGTQQLADGDYEAAIVQFNAAIEKNPRNAEAHFRRAQAEDALGRLDAALNDYRQAVALHDEIVRAQGSADVQRRAEYADAVRLENNPYLVGGYEIAVLERMAAAHFKAGEYARAIDDYSAAIRAGSRHAGVYRERGRAYLECELADLAAIDLESAVRLAPSDADTLCLLADA